MGSPGLRILFISGIPCLFLYKITAMRYSFSFIFLLTIAIACKQKVISGVELENKLIKTMQDYLDETGKPGAVYKVEDVTFYADKEKKLYLCEFHVNVKASEAKLDTTGIMKADIPNDFSKVLRKQ